MERISLPDDRVELSDLVDRVEAGESIEIVRDGKAVAHLVKVSRPREPIDVEELRARLTKFPPAAPDDVCFVERMREEDRY